MRKWIEFMTPGGPHEQLKYKAGRWTVKMEIWDNPGAPSRASVGEAEMKLILGGRYLLDTTNCTFDGMPFEGMGITGYDNLKKKFVTVWIDNLGTGLSVGEGTCDESKKTYSFNMMAPDAVSGTYKPTRAVERVVSDDQWVFEMFETEADGKERLTMRSTYSRNK